MTETVQIGLKIRRIREIVGMKQDTLASKLGISHQAVSKIEQSESIEEEKLQQIAEALGVTPKPLNILTKALLSTF